MAKTKISEFSATPANNTDIDSIFIGEGMAPSNVNDAIRELMSQLKDFQTGAVGDSFNGPIGSSTASTGAFTTLSASSSVTLSGGTANGVAYLNGSKVVTSGSALTFNGTNFATTASNFDLNPASGAPNISLREGNTYRAYLEGNSSGLLFGIGASATEQMRLTSTGLGIGTSSPASKLHLKSTTGTAETLITLQTAFSNPSGNKSIVWADNSNTLGAIAVKYSSPQASMVFGSLYNSGYNTTDLMTLDGSGNLGLGVTPSAWYSGNSAKVFEFGSAGNAILQYGSTSNITSYYLNNAYLNTSASFIYGQTGGGASSYRQNNGTHAWNIAASGTAGNAITFTQAMTLDASGNLGIGTTSPLTKLHVNLNSSTAYHAITIGNNAGGGQFGLTSGGVPFFTNYSANSSFAFGYQTSTNTASTFVEAGRFDGSGNLLVGTTSTQSSAKITANSTTNTSSVFSAWNSTSSGDAQFIWFGTESGGTTRGTITFNRSGGLTVYNTTSDYRAKTVNGAVQNALSKVALLKPSTGRMNGATQDIDFFVAHELQEVVPSAVTGEKDAVNEDNTPKYQMVDKSALIPLLTAAIQELKAEFDAYKASHP